MSIKISVVIPVKNEEVRIRRCLDSLKAWADEIVIVDDFSDDQTVAIARQEYGATIVSQALGKDWARQRNFGAKVSRNDWVLQLDADEVVPRETSLAIENVFSKSIDVQAYELTRVNVLFDTQLLHCGLGAYVRLYDRRCAVWQGEVHEQLMVQGKTDKIDAFIEHYPVDSLDYFLGKNLSYAKISANEYLKKIEAVDVKEMKQRLGLKALKLFWKSYVRKKGYKDGMPGFIWCILLVMTSQMFALMVCQQAYDSGKIKR